MTNAEYDLLRGYNAAMRNQPRDPFETDDYYEGYDQCKRDTQRQPTRMTAEDLNRLCHRIADVLATRHPSSNA